jgi:hypothetical protein
MTPLDQDEIRALIAHWGRELSHTSPAISLGGDASVRHAIRRIAELGGMLNDTANEGSSLVGVQKIGGAFVYCTNNELASTEVSP